MFRPQCFSHSRRLTPPAPCEFVSPHYHVQDFSSGVFPDNQPAKLSPARTLLSLTLQAAPRLQGLVQLPIRYTCVSFNLRWPRSPLEFMLPRVFLNAPCNAFTLLRSRPSSPISRCEIDVCHQRINRCIAFPTVSSHLYPSKLCDLLSTLPLTTRSD